jgi:ketosteroid isomerase-like protein
MDETHPLLASVLRFYRYLELRDLARLGQLLDDDAVWIAATGPPPGMSLHGRHEILTHLARRINDSGGTFTARAVEVFCGGDGSVIVVQEEPDEAGADPATTALVRIEGRAAMSRIVTFSAAHRTENP